MPYNIFLADSVREYLSEIPDIEIRELQMFGGLAFLVNDKMCINIVRDMLMCRFDPKINDEILEKQGVLPMIMKGKEFLGYCYVEEIGYKSRRDFVFWLNLCLDYNKKLLEDK